MLWIKSLSANLFVIFIKHGFKDTVKLFPCIKNEIANVILNVNCNLKFFKNGIEFYWLLIQDAGAKSGRPGESHRVLVWVSMEAGPETKIHM